MSAADRRKYRRPHIADEGRDYDDRDAEITRLRHDIERHIAIASEHATECERLRDELAECRRVVAAARAVVSNPMWQGGICDEECELEAAVNALAEKENAKP